MRRVSHVTLLYEPGIAIHEPANMLTFNQNTPLSQDSALRRNGHNASSFNRHKTSGGARGADCVNLICARADWYSQVFD